MSAAVEYHATIHEETGSYWAEVAELPGCFASGDSLDELREALLEAISLYLAPAPPAPEDGGPGHLRVGAMTVVAGA